MPPTYTVRASVVDSRSDAPRPTDRFFVDTNVWAWEHYSGSRMTPAGIVVPQAREYPRYLLQTRTAGATRHSSGVTATELAHLIEQHELNAYAAAVGPLPPKDYRHNHPAERARVAALIQRVWGRVMGDSTFLSITLDALTTTAALARLTTELVDGYDLLLLETMASAGVSQILTDDGDFCTVAGIEVFTANPRVLAAARAQGRLVVR